MPSLIWKKKKKNLCQVFHNIFMKSIKVKIKGCMHCQRRKQFPLIKYVHASSYYVENMPL